MFASGLGRCTRTSADSNGNVILLTDERAQPAARYSYDAFGQTITATGPAASINRYRFSTKPTENGSGLAYYGYRYYDPALGRWSSRDPIENLNRNNEQDLRDAELLFDSTNIYLIAKNDTCNQIDLLGLLSTLKFIWWYETKRGALYNINAEGELAELRALSGIQKAEHDFTDIAFNTLKDNAGSFCSGRVGEHTYHYSDRENKLVRDLTNDGCYWLGRSTLMWGLEGELRVDCSCRRFQYVGPLKMSLRDRGEDPFSIGVEVGTPYKIEAHWDITNDIGGSFDG